MSGHKIEYRSVIKFLANSGKVPDEIHRDFKKSYGNNAPHPSTVQRWYNKFSLGKSDIRVFSCLNLPW